MKPDPRIETGAARSIGGQPPVLELQAFLDRTLGRRRGLRVLEAGCGSSDHFDFGPDRHLTGIDISEKQLARNTALDEAIHGDLETFDFPEDAFDVIVSWNVLEHLNRPGTALDRLVPSLRPGGLMILGMPNPRSVKGLVTKLLPHALHVAYYRHVHGNRNAGRDDMGPFRTYMRRDISAPRLRARAARNGLEVVYEDVYDILDVIPTAGPKKPFWLLYRSARDLSRLVSFGFLGGSELIVVLRRPLAPDTAAPSQ